mmetsp:Transcript_25485/g.81778  ORF Transcript_25485/g.81778 Transcript_25485/m.81778 type:complete len:203 (+) Transcript_25485:851-1459(+)
MLRLRQTERPNGPCVPPVGCSTRNSFGSSLCFWKSSCTRLMKLGCSLASLSICRSASASGGGGGLTVSRGGGGGSAAGADGGASTSCSGRTAGASASVAAIASVGCCCCSWRLCSRDARRRSLRIVCSSSRSAMRWRSLRRASARRQLCARSSSALAGGKKSSSKTRHVLSTSPSSSCSTKPTSASYTSPVGLRGSSRRWAP